MLLIRWQDPTTVLFFQKALLLESPSCFALCSTMFSVRDSIACLIIVFIAQDFFSFVLHHGIASFLYNFAICRCDFLCVCIHVDFVHANCEESRCVSFMALVSPTLFHCFLIEHYT